MKSLALAGLTVVAIAGAADPLGGRVPRPVPLLCGESARYSTPPSPTQREYEDATEAMASGRPLPPGWSREESLGRVEATFTGRRLWPSGHEAIAVTVEDEPEDLDVVRFLVNGLPAAEASRANGGIVDGGALAVATLEAHASPLPGTTYAVEWVPAHGPAHVSRYRALTAVEVLLGSSREPAPPQPPSSSERRSRTSR